MQLNSHIKTTKHVFGVSMTGEELEAALDQLDQLITDLAANRWKVPAPLSDIYNLLAEVAENR